MSGAGVFNYSLGDSLSWITSSSAPLSGQTPSLASGATYTLNVTLTAPPGPSTNVLRWTAALDGNPATAQTCVSAFSDTCPITLGVGHTPHELSFAVIGSNPFSSNT